MAENDPDPSPAQKSPNPVRSRESKPLGLLAWIAAYKLIKAIIATSAGVIVYRLGGHNLVVIGHRWLIHAGMDPEGRMGASLLARLAHFNVHRLYFAMAIFFAYAALYCIEAVGLFLEKRWAEWLTVLQTAILVPVEVYEMVVRPGPIKGAALMVSVGVIFYLVWRIRSDDLDEKIAAPPR